MMRRGNPDISLSHKEIVSKYLASMADACAVRELSRLEIRRKLERKFIPQPAITEIITTLEENNFINETRYAKAYTHDKLTFSKWGKWKIIEGLKAKGISEKDIYAAISEISKDTLRAKTLECAKQKARSLDMTDISNKRRLYTYLASCGFDSEDISYAIQHISTSNDADYYMD